MVKSNLPYIFTGIFAVALLFSLPNYANAQGPNRPSRYQSPSGPVISPYFDYFRRDVGALNPYNTFIRPGQQRRQYNRQQSQAVSGLRNQVQGIQNAKGVAPSRVSPTGKGATFMNYSHYYRMGR